MLGRGEVGDYAGLDLSIAYSYHNETDWCRRAAQPGFLGIGEVGEVVWAPVEVEVSAIRSDQVAPRRQTINPQCIDHQRKGRGGLAAAGVVQVKAAERFTPVLQHPNKPPFGQV